MTSSYMHAGKWLCKVSEVSLLVLSYCIWLWWHTWRLYTENQPLHVVSSHLYQVPWKMVKWLESCNQDRQRGWERKRTHTQHGNLLCVLFKNSFLVTKVDCIFTIWWSITEHSPVPPPIHMFEICFVADFSSREQKEEERVHGCIGEESRSVDRWKYRLQEENWEPGRK